MKNKYNIGDILVLIGRDHYKISKNCPICDGDGILSTSSGKTVNCTQCKGSGIVYKDDTKFTIIKDNYAVDVIRCGYDTILYANYFDFEDSTDWELEDDLFFTKEGAQAECDKRNGKS